MEGSRRKKSRNRKQNQRQGTNQNMVFSSFIHFVFTFCCCICIGLYNKLFLFYLFFLSFFADGFVWTYISFRSLSFPFPLFSLFCFVMVVDSARVLFCFDDQLAEISWRVEQDLPINAPLYSLAEALKSRTRGSCCTRLFVVVTLLIYILSTFILRKFYCDTFSLAGSTK